MGYANVTAAVRPLHSVREQEAARDCTPSNIIYFYVYVGVGMAQVSGLARRG